MITMRKQTIFTDKPKSIESVIVKPTYLFDGNLPMKNYAYFIVGSFYSFRKNSDDLHKTLCTYKRKVANQPLFRLKLKLIGEISWYGSLYTLLP